MSSDSKKYMIRLERSSRVQFLEVRPFSLKLEGEGWEKPSLS